MTNKSWLNLGPAVLLALGIIVATAVAVWTAESLWLVLIGPLLLAFAIVAADALGSRLRGQSFAPSWGALMLAATFLAACLILALADPAGVAPMIPILGSGCAGYWVAVGAASRSKACRWL